MRLKLGYIVGIGILVTITTLAMTPDLPLVWIISAKRPEDMSANDKERLRTGVSAWIADAEISLSNVTTHTRCKNNTSFRRFAFLFDAHVGKDGVPMTQEKARQWCAGFDDPLAVVITNSVTPRELCESLGWTNIIEDTR